MQLSNLIFILTSAFMVTASPGPASLSIADTSLGSGRHAGLALAAGIVTGSLFWSASAAFGLGALMKAYPWVLDIVRYLGAGYLLWLAVKSAQVAIWNRGVSANARTDRLGGLQAYQRGLLIHLTNPKAILFFASIYAIALPADTSLLSLAIVVLALLIQSSLIFFGYALLFSDARISSFYKRSRRFFSGVFALGFGAAAFKVLISA
ncbi:LysE family translocator [Salinisphaera orenii]|uniref:Amino acid transporter n=1 Tax=Salinisphaera orenii YIM 95161 TaxID=1051139 RepID=A0A423Q5U1_9GAMM|nr:LysE family translocator [Salinisphaera halophila]ROO34939.1 amino acid transporter [Salinisphaera halophila YIM 95161]